MDTTGQRHASAALPPRKQLLLNVELEAGWVPELFWMSKREVPDPIGTRNTAISRFPWRLCCSVAFVFNIIVSDGHICSILLEK